jgi:predicted xylose isomerase-like sugar epimerase
MTIHAWVRVLFARIAGVPPATSATIDAVRGAIVSQEIGATMAGRRAVGPVPSANTMHSWAAKKGPKIPSIDNLLSLIEWAESRADRSAIVVAWAAAVVEQADRKADRKAVREVASD